MADLVNTRTIAILLTSMSLLAPSATRAEQYESGIKSWDVNGKKLTMVAGVLTDNARLYYLNYSFYLQGKDRLLLQVPLVNDKTKPDGYKLSFSTFNGGGEIISDAKVVVKRDQVYLLTAHKNALHGYGRPGSIETKTYRLVEGDEAEWRSYFSAITQKEYSASQNYSVERSLDELARDLR